MGQIYFGAACQKWVSVESALTVDRMPGSKPPGQCAPLTAVLCDIQNRVDDGQVLMRDVAALTRQILLNATELFGGNFHADIISNSVNRP